jgi:NAD(P)-dependent dehydrogenase (short-subunit alcohol dehydrogenase family)
MMVPSDMTGKVALVTGAAAGLGQASAIRLAELGADVSIVDVAEAGLAETAKTIAAFGRRVLVLPLDLSSRANCRAA